MITKDYKKDALIVTAEPPDEDTTDEYEFPAVADDTVEDVYVAEKDTNYPDDVMEFVRRWTDAHVLEDGEGDRVKSVQVREINCRDTEMHDAYYLKRMPPETVVPLADAEDPDLARRELKQKLDDREVHVESLKRAYYYPVLGMVEIWLDSFLTAQAGYLPGLHRVLNIELAAVEVRPVEQIAVDEYDADIEFEDDTWTDDADTDDNSSGLLGGLVGRDDPDPVDEDEENPDPVLEDRQRRKDIEGTYYPDQATDDQLDDEDESKYPDADGKLDDS